MAAIVHTAKGDKFIVDPGSLGYSVMVFCIFALCCIALMMLRRKAFIGGELGGTQKYRLPTSMFMFGLWVAYIILSSLETYCHIKGF
jgi:solute carrier family 8 (sodium/calcium exchanger)